MEEATSPFDCSYRYLVDCEFYRDLVNLSRASVRHTILSTEQERNRDPYLPWTRTHRPLGPVILLQSAFDGRLAAIGQFGRLFDDFTKHDDTMTGYRLKWRQSLR